MISPSTPHPLLRLLFWESTVRCNLACAHCRRLEDNTAASSDMSTEQALQLIEQIARLGRSQGVMPMLIFSGGEPLCRSDLFELIQAAKAHTIKCALATNGTLIDAAVAETIRAAGLERVAVSLDGVSASVHNKLRSLEGAFEAALQGIDHLRACGVPFQINMTMTRQNAVQLDEMFLLAKNLGAAAIHFFMLVPVGCGGEIPREEMLTAAEYERLLTHLAHAERTREIEIKVTCAPHYERIRREQRIPSRHGAKGCLAGLGVLFVSHRGRVFPCGYLPVECGTILDTPLEHIWTGSTDLARMRDTEQLKGTCGICEYRVVCGGCRARAFAATGDYMQAEPMCDYTPSQENQP